MRDSIQRLIQSGKLSRAPVTDGEIMGLWADALQAFEAARRERTSAGDRLDRAYDAGRFGVRVLMRSRELRINTAGLTAGVDEFMIAWALPLRSTSLWHAIREFAMVRRRRYGAGGDWQGDVSDMNADWVVRLVDRLLEHVAMDLRRHRRSLWARIPPLH